MKAQILIAFTLVFASINAFDATEYHYNAGAKYDQNEADMSFGGSADVLKFKDDMGKAGEAHVTKTFTNGVFHANAGLTHSEDKYAHADVAYGDKINNGNFGASGNVDYLNNYTNGTAVVGWTGEVSNISVQAGAQASFDSLENKDYSVGVKANKNIDSKTNVMGAAGLKNKDAAVEGAVSYVVDQIEATATAFAAAEYNLDSKANAYGVGAMVTKKVYNDKIDLTAGAAFYPKNESKLAFASAKYADAIEGGSVSANAAAGYDLNNKAVTQKHLDASVNKDFGNGLQAGANAQLDGDSGFATGNAKYTKNIDATTNVNADATATYGLTAKQIISKGANVAVNKDFENGLTAGAAAHLVNDMKTADAHAVYTKMNNDVLYKAGANVDYNLDTKNATGTFGAIANTLYNKEMNISAYAAVLTQFNDFYNGNFGVLFNDVKNVNSGSVNVATNFRGAKPTVGNVVATFKHIFDAETDMDVEVTRFPDNTFQLSGNLNKVMDGNKTFKAYFKMDKDGNFVFA